MARLNFTSQLIIVMLLALFWHSNFSFSQSNSVESIQARVSLLSETERPLPGSHFYLGVLFELHEGWHIYWQNPGDSGTAPNFDFTSPADFEIKPIEWPTPKKIPVAHLVNYGYDGKVLLLAPVVAPETFNFPLTFSARGEWLACKEDCIPGEGLFSITLTGSKTQSAEVADLFVREKAKIPSEGASILESALISESEVRLVLGRHFDNPSFIPITPRLIRYAAPQELDRFSDRPGGVLRLKRGSIRSHPSSISGLLIDSNSSGQNAYRIESPLVKEESRDFEFGPLLSAILFAFLGGMLLNVMPCVFPVLGLKIFHLIEHHDGKKQALLFSLGIIASFWVLLFLILSFKSVGTEFGWGFQLQEPSFVLFMAVLFFILALNMLGVVEFGATIQRLTGKASLGSDSLGSFLSGVLTTAVATPCTAPFMGVALAYALSASTVTSILVFSSMGLGLSSPFLVAVLSPGFRCLLPKPGHWMARLKIFLSLPLFLSSVWLGWVLSLQVESKGVFLLLCACVAVFIGAWLIRRSSFLGSAHRKQVLIVGYTILLLSILYPVIAVQDLGRISTENQDYVDEWGQRWLPYSDSLIKDLQGSRRAIYLDFTAAWCITCQVNKKIVFSSDEVRKLLVEKNIALVRADWTSKSPNIGQGLRRFGRESVPLNVIYPAGPGSFTILPTILTPETVLDAIRKASDNNGPN